jgi:hypothetical protein
MASQRLLNLENTEDMFCYRRATYVSLPQPLAPRHHQQRAQPTDRASSIEQPAEALPATSSGDALPGDALPVVVEEEQARSAPRAAAPQMALPEDDVSTKKTHLSHGPQKIFENELSLCWIPILWLEPRVVAVAVSHRLG